MEETRKSVFLIVRNNVKRQMGVNMYKRYVLYFCIFQCMLITAIASVIGIKTTRFAATPAFQIQLLREKEERTSQYSFLPNASSGQRVVSYQVLEKDTIIELKNEDYENLLKIVEAEAGGEDNAGKMLVANVVINRVMDKRFPDTVTEVIFQKEAGITQFSPISDGRFAEVSVTEETKDVVDRALLGENIANGALYFAARDSADPEKMLWFDTHLKFLFSHGGHEFFQ